MDDGLAHRRSRRVGRAHCLVPTVSMRLQPVFWRPNVHSRLIDSVDRPVGDLDHRGLIRPPPDPPRAFADVRFADGNLAARDMPSCLRLQKPATMERCRMPPSLNTQAQVLRLRYSSALFRHFSASPGSVASSAHSSSRNPRLASRAAKRATDQSGLGRATKRTSSPAFMNPSRITR